MTRKPVDKPTPPAETGQDTDPSYHPTRPLDLDESVAGEEDPGASVDISIEPVSPPPSGQPPGKKP